MLDLYRALEMQKALKSPTSLPCPGGHRVAGTVGGVWGKKQLSAKLKNEPFHQFIRGGYFTRATGFGHYLGKQLCSNRALVLFCFPQ